MSEETTSETGNETTTTETTETTSTETGGADLQAEVDKWKALSKKNEDRAKANATAAKELEDLKAKSMSEQEKAVATAKEEGKTEARRESALRLVDAEVRAAAAGRKVDVDALLEGLDRTRFVDDDGEPDTKGISAWLDKLAPKDGRVDLGQGARGGSGNGADMNAMLRQAAGRG